MDSSLRNVLNDMAEHMPILKNNQNMYHFRFGFTHKIDIAFPKMGVLFWLLKYVLIVIKAYSQRLNQEVIWNVM